MSIKQAFLKLNESSLNKKSDVVEIDVASNHIHDTHEMHEVSITRKVQERETLQSSRFGCCEGVFNLTKKRWRIIQKVY